MTQGHSAEEIESRIKKVLDGFREVLAANGFDGVDLFHVEVREAASMKALFASESGCIWQYICKPTPQGWKCSWECV